MLALNTNQSINLLIRENIVILAKLHPGIPAVLSADFICYPEYMSSSNKTCQATYYILNLLNVHLTNTSKH